MRFPDDYMGEMATTKVLDWEIERLLAGSPVEGGQLYGVAPVVEMIRTQWTRTPSEADVQKFAAGASLVVQATRPGASALVKPQRGRMGGGRLGLSMRLATMVFAILLLSGTAGMAMAADGAVPGDALYGLDRAFEVVGIGSGSTEERLGEAVVMAAHGRSGEAIAHGIDALSQETGDESEAATRALVIAAENLVDAQDTAEAAATANIRVTALLTYIADNIGIDEGTNGREFGQGVAELARDIGKGDDQTGAPNPAVAPAPGQGQSNNPGAGAGNDGTMPGSGNGNGNGQGNGNGNGNSNGNGQPDPTGAGNGQEDGNGQPDPTGAGNGNGNSNGNGQPDPTGAGNGQEDGNGNGQESGPPVDPPAVTAPGLTTPDGANSASEDSPSATAPGNGNKG